MLTSLAKHYGFDVNKPYEDLDPEHKAILLHGSGGEELEFAYINDRGSVFKRRHAFEGILPNIERRYRDTESSSVREELSKYVSTAPCHSCGGTRLCADARSVYVDGKTLPSITQLPVGEAHAYFEALEMEGRQGEIADKILKELRARYRFLVDVGLNYLTLNRSAETLSGGEAQRIRWPRKSVQVLSVSCTSSMSRRLAFISVIMSAYFAPSLTFAILVIRFWSWTRRRCDSHGRSCD